MSSGVDPVHYTGKELLMDGERSSNFDEQQSNQGLARHSHSLRAGDTVVRCDVRGSTSSRMHQSNATADGLPRVENLDVAQVDLSFEAEPPGAWMEVTFKPLKPKQLLLCKPQLLWRSERPPIGSFFFIIDRSLPPDAFLSPADGCGVSDYSDKYAHRNLQEEPPRLLWYDSDGLQREYVDSVELSKIDLGDKAKPFGLNSNSHSDKDEPFEFVMRCNYGTDRHKHFIGDYTLKAIPSDALDIHGIASSTIKYLAASRLATQLRELTDKQQYPGNPITTIDQFVEFTVQQTATLEGKVHIFVGSSLGSKWQKGVMMTMEAGLNDRNSTGLRLSWEGSNRAFVTGRKALRHVNFPGRPHCIEFEGYYLVPEPKPSKRSKTLIQVDLCSPAKKRRMLEFLEKPTACEPLAIRMKKQNHEKFEVFPGIGGGKCNFGHLREVLCDRMEWMVGNIAHNSTEKWTEGWVTIVRDHHCPHWRIEIFKHMGSDKEEQTFHLTSGAFLSSYKNLRRTILIDNKKHPDGPQDGTTDGKKNREQGLNALILRLADDHKHQLWTHALFEALRMACQPDNEESSGGEAVLGEYGWLKEQLIKMESQATISKQFRDLAATVTNTKQLQSPEELNLLTKQFMELVAPPFSLEMNIDDFAEDAVKTQIRRARYAEMWCRFILLLKGDLREQKEILTHEVVIKLILKVDLKPFLSHRTQSTRQPLDRAGRLLHLVEALLYWAGGESDDFLKELAKYLEMNKVDVQDLADLRLLLDQDHFELKKMQIHMKDEEGKFPFPTIRNKALLQEPVIKVDLQPFKKEVTERPGAPVLPLQLKESSEQQQLQVLEWLMSHGTYDSDQAVRYLAKMAIEHDRLKLLGQAICEVCLKQKEASNVNQEGAVQKKQTDLKKETDRRICLLKGILMALVDEQLDSTAFKALEDIICVLAPSHSSEGEDAEHPLCNQAFETLVHSFRGHSKFWDSLSSFSVEFRPSPSTLSTRSRKVIVGALRFVLATDLSKGLPIIWKLTRMGTCLMQDHELRKRVNMLLREWNSYCSTKSSHNTFAGIHGLFKELCGSESDTGVLLMPVFWSNAGLLACSFKKERRSEQSDNAVFNHCSTFLKDNFGKEDRVSYFEALMKCLLNRLEAPNGPEDTQESILDTGTVTEAHEYLSSALAALLYCSSIVCEDVGALWKRLQLILGRIKKQEKVTQHMGTEFEEKLVKRVNKLSDDIQKECHEAIRKFIVHCAREARDTEATEPQDESEETLADVIFNLDRAMGMRSKNPVFTEARRMLDEVFNEHVVEAYTKKYPSKLRAYCEKSLPKPLRDDSVVAKIYQEEDVLACYWKKEVREMLHEFPFESFNQSKERKEHTFAKLCLKALKQDDAVMKLLFILIEHMANNSSSSEISLRACLHGLIMYMSEHVLASTAFDESVAEDKHRYAVPEKMYRSIELLLRAFSKKGLFHPPSDASAVNRSRERGGVDSSSEENILDLFRGDHGEEEAKKRAETLRSFAWYFCKILEYNKPSAFKQTSKPSSKDGTQLRTPEQLGQGIQSIFWFATRVGYLYDCIKELMPVVVEEYISVHSVQFKQLREDIYAILEKTKFKQIDQAYLKLVRSDDRLLSQPEFWNESILDLFSSEAMHKDYPKLNKIEGGIEFYYKLVSFCIQCLNLQPGEKAKQAKIFEKMKRASHAEAEASGSSMLQRRFSLLTRPRGYTLQRKKEIDEKAERTRRVLNKFENNPKIVKFFQEIFPSISLRKEQCASSDSSRNVDFATENNSMCFDEVFHNFEVEELAVIAENGQRAIEKLKEVGPDKMMELFQKYLRDRHPTDWARLFLEAEQGAYMLKYMLREKVELAKEQFKFSVNGGDPQQWYQGMEGPPKDLFNKLVEEALADYGEEGIIDSKRIGGSIIDNPQELLDALEASMKAQKSEKLKLIQKISLHWMEIAKENNKQIITPHHSQVLIMLMFDNFYEMKKKKKDDRDENIVNERSRDDPSDYECKYENMIAEMSTGEGKSIVIAMLAIFIVEKHKKNVHILENSRGLMERDHKTYKPLFEKFGIDSYQMIKPPSSGSKPNVCYCLKKDNQKYFSSALQDGTLELQNTILIVDEVDDLVVNESPAAKYGKKDDKRTELLQQAFKAVHSFEGKLPEARESFFRVVNTTNDQEEKWARATFIEAMRAHKTLEKKEEGRHYTKNGDKYVELDEKGQIPKVPKSYGWLNYLNWSKSSKPAIKWSPCLLMCTPYMYNQYACIFGLTGSVGGAEERKYIETTFKAVPFRVPLFLRTCENTDKTPPSCKGFDVAHNEDDMISMVIEHTKNDFQKVPVLIIAQDQKEMQKIWKRLREKDSPLHSQCPDFLEKHVDMLQDDERAADVIGSSTELIGTGESAYFPVTVTDRYGGRGHDFKCKEETANKNGGLLVIATSVPDKREWIQWLGRTGRQDNPGQYRVVVSRDQEILKKGVPKLLQTLEDQTKTPEEKIDAILEEQDKDILETLSTYSAEQAQGYWLNQLCQLYYRQDAGKRQGEQERPCWPTKKDRKLIEMLEINHENGIVIKEKAKEAFQLELKGPPSEWEFDEKKKFGLPPKQKFVLFLVDRSQSDFLKLCTRCISDFFQMNINDKDLVAYCEILEREHHFFEPAQKWKEADTILSAIENSLHGPKEEGSVHLLHSIRRSLEVLLDRKDKYAADKECSKWLIVLSDFYEGDHKKDEKEHKKTLQQIEEAMKEVGKDGKEFNFFAVDVSAVSGYSATIERKLQSGDLKKVAQGRDAEKRWEASKDRMAIVNGYATTLAEKNGCGCGEIIRLEKKQDEHEQMKQVQMVFDELATAMEDAGEVGDDD